MTPIRARRAGQALAAAIMSAALSLFLLHDAGQARSGAPRVLAAAALR